MMYIWILQNRQAMKDENDRTRAARNCPASRCRMFHGENNELIFIQTYNGDWDSWDDPQTDAPGAGTENPPKKEAPH